MRSRSSRLTRFASWLTSGALVAGVLVANVLTMSPARATDLTPHGEAHGTICNGVASFTWTGSGFLSDSAATVRAGKSPYIDDPSIKVTGTSDADGNVTLTGTAPVTDGWKPNVAYDWAMGVMGQSGTSNLSQDEAGFMLVDCNAPPNNPPHANDDTATTIQDTAVTVNVLQNDTDADNDTLSVATFDSASAQGGTVTLVSNQLQYTPASGFSGTDTFGYTAGDGKDGSNKATVTMTVNPANQPPVANDDSFLVVEGSTVDLDVLQNDSDPNTGDTLSVASVGPADHGTATRKVDGTKVTYAAPSNYTGPASFTYVVSDGKGGTDTGTVNVLVSAPSPTVVTPRKPSVSWGTGKYVAYLYVHVARTSCVQYLVGSKDYSGRTIRVSPSLLGKPAHKVTVTPKAKATCQLNQHYSGWTTVNPTKVVRVGGYAIAGNGKEKIDRIGYSVPRAYRHSVIAKGYLNGHVHKLIKGVLYIRVGQTGKIVLKFKSTAHHVVFQNLQRSIVAVKHRNRG